MELKFFSKRCIQLLKLAYNNNITTESEMNAMQNSVKKWNIYMCKLEGKGSVQCGLRPIIVVSNDIGNKLGNTVTIIPLTSRINKKPLPFHIYITKGTLKMDSLALCEQIQTIAKEELGKFIGTIESNIIRKQIEKGILTSLGMVA